MDSLTVRSARSGDRHISLAAAINNKYGNGNSDVSWILPSIQEHHSSASSFKKAKANDHLCLSRRKLLVLNDQNIDNAGDLDELSDLLHNITDLNLAKNDFKSWEELCQIFSRTPSLQHCDLSYNLPLSSPTLPPTATLNFQSLTSLVLNATNIRILCLIDILKRASCLRELHLSCNDYANIEDQLLEDNFTLSSTDSKQRMTFNTVHVLHLNRCNLDSWRALTTMCRLFPCLENLVAPENPIKSLAFTECNDEHRVTEVFGCLHSLNMNRWLVQYWSDIDQLKLLPLLNEIRASGLPLFSSHEDNERRMLFIARLPDLTNLNGSAITPTNREEAERFFIRYYMDKSEKPHRYHELVNKHGRLNKLAEVDLAPKQFADVLLVYEDANKSEHRRISLNQNVAQFKKSLHSFCELPPNRIRLWYLDSETSAVLGMEELRYPGIMLYALRVADGGEFHIQAKPEWCWRRKNKSGSTTSNSAGSSIKESD